MHNSCADRGPRKRGSGSVCRDRWTEFRPV